MSDDPVHQLRAGMGHTDNRAGRKGADAMSDELVTQARQALEGTTPGPWQSDILCNVWGQAAQRHGKVANLSARPQSDSYDIIPADEVEANARFIAAAPTLVAAMADRIEALTSEVGELQEVFDFQWRAHMRAVEMWRTANPGNDLVLPDSAKLTVWMLEQLEAARADAKEAEAYAEELAGDQVDLCSQLIAAEDKLAECEARLGKAVEALEIIRDRQFYRMGPGITAQVIARAVLAEIEGEQP
jgi:hypothetical protein